MALLLHIGIAFGSLAFCSYLFFYPSKTKFKLSYCLIGLTLVTGSYLIWSNPAHMVQACISGLSYLAVIFTLLVGARLKLTRSLQK